MADAGVPLSRVHELVAADEDEFAAAVGDIDRRLRDRLRVLQVPARAIEMDRDAWILVAARIPDRMPAPMAMKRSQIEDPAVTAMYLDLVEPTGTPTTPGSSRSPITWWARWRRTPHAGARSRPSGSTWATTSSSCSTASSSARCPAPGRCCASSSSEAGRVGPGSNASPAPRSEADRAVCRPAGDLSSSARQADGSSRELTREMPERGDDQNQPVDLRAALWAVGIAAALWVASWIAMVLFASRLPPGLLRDVATFLPACVTAARRLRRSPAVPRRSKLALLIAVLWVISPIDLLPEFLPVIGPLDDVVAVVLLLRYAARRIPRPDLLAAWPADRELLERMLDGRRGRPQATPSG